MRRTLLARAAYRTSSFILLTLLIIAGLSLNLGLSHADNLSISTAADCSGNSVINCGATSVNNLINKYENGDGVNSAASIQHIYSYFGITPDDIHDMNSVSTSETVEVGMVNKDGSVYGSGGKLIASHAVTAGRIEGKDTAGNQAESYGGTNFFVRSPKVSFSSDNLAAYVVMVNNQFAFAILASCGNPVTATPIAPPKPTPKPVPKPTQPAPAKTTNSYCSGNTVNEGSVASQGGSCSQNTVVVQTQTQTQPPAAPTPLGECTSLSLDIVQSSPLEVSVTANPSTSNGAQLSSVVFDFGDGTVVSAGNQTTATHTYSSSGSHVITANLSFSAPNNQSVPNATCQAEITSTSPPPVVTTAASVTPTTTTRPTAAPLPNTGPGDVIALLGATSFIGLVGYRIFLSHRFKVQ